MQQLPAQADAAGMGRDRDGVQARQGGSAVEQQQGITGQLSIGLLGPGIGPVDHPMEAARGQAITGETVRLELQQGGQVIGCGRAKDKIHITTVKVA